MKILVTGGAGFIGSHLTDALLALKHKILVIDNLSSGSKKNLNLENKNLVFIQKDICSNLEDIFKKYRPEVIFHLAGQIDVRHSMKDPMEDARVNILGSLNLIQESVKYKIKKIIFSSTGGAIYGEPKVIPVKEDCHTEPLSNYGLSKRTVEEYLKFYDKQYGLQYIILRYGNVYGPRQNPHGEAGVVAIFINQLLQKKSVNLFDNGKQKRDYIYVKDVVIANIKALNILKSEIYNIGTGQMINTKTVLQYIEKELGIKAKFSKKPARTGEIKKIALDSSKAFKQLNWKPVFSFRKGIQETVSYMS